MQKSTLQNILYIEDDEGLARLLQKRLQRLRFNVDIAVSAEDGIECIDRNKYDLILLDYHLPGMTGLEALDIIVAKPETPPVILLTASGDEGVAVSALEKGAADYAVKDNGQSYFDLLPAIMQAAFTKEALLRENERQREELSIAKEKAESANQAKSNFLATMSHEIRTPLNVVVGLTTVLSNSNLDTEQKRIVSTLRSNADLLMKLINDLLDISRIEAGHLELESTRFAFSDVLDDIKAMFDQHAQQKDIALRFENSTEKQFYIGDRIRVQQVLMNLVSNAIKFTEKGSVTIKTEYLERNDGPSCIKLIVQDTGIGISTEKFPTIFNKFTQADETITRRYGGSGLGLSIAYSLAKLMKGDITVESEMGKGSLFTAILCLKKCTGNWSEVEVPPADRQVIYTSGSKIVLLVEDYAPNVMVATLMLEELGFEVLAVSNGNEALQKVVAHKESFAAILMDVQMQGMDGLETTKRIREYELSSGIRNTIIGVTAHALAGDRERCISAGMDDYISKPIHPDILAAKLRAVTQIEV